MEENIQGGGVEDKDKDGNYLHIVPSSIKSLVEEYIRRAGTGF